jgi:abortive infection bacteriophage resistance protein
MNYTKKYYSTTEHIVLMKSRGLVFGDEAFAARTLEVVSYYRLTGYGLHLRILNSDGTRSDNFQPGTTFEQIVSLYEFDRQLRLLVLDAVERFEVGFRSRMSNGMASTHGPHWFLNHSLFNNKVDKVTGNLLFDPNDFVEAATRHGQTLSIRHYVKTYTDPPCPPTWMLAEAGTFGLWSRGFGMLANRSDQKPIADAFRLPVPEFVSFSQAINDLRNKCAHHSRVWDARFANGPKITGMLTGIATDNQALFAQLSALIYCLWTIDPMTQWLDRLEMLINECPSDFQKLMGFPSDWKTKLLGLYKPVTGLTGLSLIAPVKPSSLLSKIWKYFIG